ncbi:hypothetical protein A1D31_23790 [Bradyrhizobium liaoningense]|nr:hypothetical protein A1D31_23790 [Bradyrhizobium liaoningense]
MAWREIGQPPDPGSSCPVINAPARGTNSIYRDTIILISEGLERKTEGTATFRRSTPDRTSAATAPTQVNTGSDRTSSDLLRAAR